MDPVENEALAAELIGIMTEYSKTDESAVGRRMWARECVISASQKVWSRCTRSLGPRSTSVTGLGCTGER